MFTLTELISFTLPLHQYFCPAFLFLLPPVKNLEQFKSFCIPITTKAIPIAFWVRSCPNTILKGSFYVPNTGLSNYCYCINKYFVRHLSSMFHMKYLCVQSIELDISVHLVKKTERMVCIFLSEMQHFA